MQKRPVDEFDEDAAVLAGLNRIGDLDQFARGFFRVRVGTVEFHWAIAAELWAARMCSSTPAMSIGMHAGGHR
jgi:hypothetical protein